MPQYVPKGGEGTALEERAKAQDREKTEKPRKYRVVLLNDHYTTMEFVVEILTAFFNKTRTDATRIMLMIHHTGSGVAGVYTRDVAETLVAQVTAPVRWEQVVRRLAAEGVTHYVEVGPGTVLSGLVRKIHPEGVVSHFAGPEDVDEVMTSLEGVRHHA